MSNSSLVDYVKISPNKNSPRKYAISKITIHHMAGNMSVEACGNMFYKVSRQASSNYGIGSDGRVGMYVEEKDRSWCSSSSENDHCAITIEVANDEIGGNWHVSDIALAKLIDLCVDICKRNGIPRLNFTGDKSGNLTMHKWFAATACPGPYLESKFPYIAEEVNKRLSNGSQLQNGIQAIDLQGFSNEKIVNTLGPIFTEDHKNTGILASVSMAQFILESAYAQSELAQKANNCFGMKKNLSGNTWLGSTWDGTSIYTKVTKEYTGSSYKNFTSDFRKYNSIEDSVRDHSAYLSGAMNGNSKRYDGLVGEIDYRKAFTIIKNGGYATSPTYVDNLCKVVENWNLTSFDYKKDEEKVDSNFEYPALPFTVEVFTSDYNYRSGPSMSYTVRGVTGKGIFTIVSLSGDWGKLKSGVGWIYLKNEDNVKVPWVTVTDVWDTNGPFLIEGATGSDKERLKELCDELSLKVTKP